MPQNLSGSKDHKFSLGIFVIWDADKPLGPEGDSFSNRFSLEFPLLLANFFIGEGLAELRPKKDEDKESKFNEEKMIGCFFHTQTSILPNLGTIQIPFYPKLSG